MTCTLLNQWLYFLLQSIILADVSENRGSLQRLSSKGHVHGLWLVDFDPFCLFLFQGALIVVVIMIDNSEKCSKMNLFNTCEHMAKIINNKSKNQ